MTEASRALAAAIAALVVDHDTVGALTQLAVDFGAVVNAPATGVMVVDGSGPLEPLAASTSLARELELHVARTVSGPAVDAFGAGFPVHEHGVGALAERWTTLGPLLAAAGFDAVYAWPMTWRGTAIGALSAYLPAGGELSDEDLVIGQAFADMATIAVVQVATAALDIGAVTHEALDNRTVIEQAKGVLAVVESVDIPTAFDRMLDQARRHGRRLDDVAREVIAQASARPRP